MTEAELAVVRSLAKTDVVTFMPEDNTAAAKAQYEATIESLREMQKAELEVNEEQTRRRARPQRKPAAAARCTAAGREALRLLGE